MEASGRDSHTEAQRHGEAEGNRGLPSAAFGRHQKAEGTTKHVDDKLGDSISELDGFESGQASCLCSFRRRRRLLTLQRLAYYQRKSRRWLGFDEFQLGECLLEGGDPRRSDFGTANVDHS